MIDPVRRDAIVRLLEHLVDELPERAPRPLSQLGFVHDTTTRESCPDCLANGLDRYPGCETCGGRGHVESRRRRDPYDTGVTAGWALGFGAEAREAAARVDAEIARLAAQTAPPKPERERQAEANKRGEPWEEARKDLWRDFDFAPLVRALELLREMDEDAYRAVHAVHVYGWLPQEGAVAGHAERGLGFIDRWMPPPPIALRAPKRVVAVSPEDRTRTARNLRIRELFADGAGVSVKRLAKQFALSVSQINRILAGGDGGPA